MHRVRRRCQSLGGQVDIYCTVRSNNEYHFLFSSKPAVRLFLEQWRCMTTSKESMRRTKVSVVLSNLRLIFCNLTRHFLHDKRRLVPSRIRRDFVLIAAETLKQVKSARMLTTRLIGKIIARARAHETRENMYTRVFLLQFNKFS